MVVKERGGSRSAIHQQARPDKIIQLMQNLDQPIRLGDTGLLYTDIKSSMQSSE